MGKNPPKAIRVMAIPLIFAFLLSSVQIYIDSFWCAGLGPDANSAITLAGPVYWVLLDIGAGLGVGASTAISRSLGAKDYGRSDSLASQSLVLIALVSVCLSILLYACSRSMISFMSGGENVDLSMEYLMPFLLFSPFLTLNGVILGMLRSEGEARKSSGLSIAASLINIVLDPILIYVLGLGLLGASLATAISFIATTAVGLYWYSSGKMFIKPKLRGFRFIREQIWDICKVGIPHSLELALIPLMMMPQNALVVKVGGTDGMITYSLPYRYITLAMVPVQAIAASMIPVVSYAIGMRNNDNVMAGIRYALKASIIISLALTVVLIVLAEPFSYAFTYSDDMARFRSEIAMVIRIYALALLSICLTHLCSSILQALCFSQLATITMFIREILFILFYYVSTFFSMTAIYWSLDAAEYLGLAMMLLCVWYALKKKYPDDRLFGKPRPAGARRMGIVRWSGINCVIMPLRFDLRSC
ncbi:MAG: MATE family efflux transporter [Candidatus Methanomethylophilaceae archaeon]|nr:MATE family efflux transporter [Candidatus Methanomethylophilaceae archaeon]